MSMVPVAVSELERVLPEYLTRQRWYRAKAKTLTTLQVRDTVPLSDNGQALIVELAYTDGDSATYLLPVTSEENAEPVAQTGLYSGLASQAFREVLLEAIVCNRVFDSENGRLVASRTRALPRECNSSEPPPQSKVSRAEQSNSSIIFGSEYILKIFRKLESGINPDLEIGRFLTERGFRHTPSVLGQLSY